MSTVTLTGIIHDSHATDTLCMPISQSNIYTT